MGNPMNEKNVDPEKLAETIKQMESKARELGWDPKMPQAEKAAAQENPKFIYVRLSESQPHGGFTLEWGIEKVGFGVFTVYPANGNYYCDTETMGADLVKAAMRHFLENEVIYDPKIDPDGP